MGFGDIFIFDPVAAHEITSSLAKFRILERKTHILEKKHDIIGISCDFRSKYGNSLNSMKFREPPRDRK